MFYQKWKGLTKPPTATRIDWSNPITKDLAFLCLFNEGAGGSLINLVDNSRGIFEDNSGNPVTDYLWQADEGGIYALNNSGAGSNLHQWRWQSTTAYNTTGPFTAAARCKFVTSGGEFARLFTNIKESTADANWGILQFNDNVNWLIHIDSNGSFSATNVSVASVGGIEFIAMTWDGSNVRTYINGILKNTTAASGAMTSYSPMNINIGNIKNGTGSPGTWNKPIYGCYYWNRCLDASELHWLNLQPYGLTYRPLRYGPKGSTIVALTQSASDQITTLADSQTNSGYALAAAGFFDQMTLLDAVSLIGGNPDFQVTLGDNLAFLKDQLTPLAPVILKTFSDSLNNLADSVSKTFGIPIAAFDSANNWSDAVQKLLAGYLTQSSSDTINNLADAVSVANLNVPFFISVADTLNHLNDTIRLWNILRLIGADNMVLSDSIQTRMPHLLRLSAVLSNFLENVDLATTNQPAFADQMTLGDSITLSMAAHVSRAVSDQFLMSDSATAVATGTYVQPGFIARIRRYLNDPQ